MVSDPFPFLWDILIFVQGHKAFLVCLTGTRLKTNFGTCLVILPIRWLLNSKKKVPFIFPATTLLFDLVRIKSSLVTSITNFLYLSKTFN